MAPPDSRVIGVGAFTIATGGGAAVMGGAPAVFGGALAVLAGALEVFGVVLAFFVGALEGLLRGALAEPRGALAFDFLSAAFVVAVPDAGTESTATGVVAGRRAGAHAPANSIRMSGSRARPVISSLVEGFQEKRRSGPAYPTPRAHRRYPSSFDGARGRRVYQL